MWSVLSRGYHGMELITYHMDTKVNCHLLGYDGFCSDCSEVRAYFSHVKPWLSFTNLS